METTALSTDKMGQRAGERRAHHEHRQRMANRQRTNALLPVLKSTARLVWPDRHLVENDRLASARRDGLLRQGKDRVPVDLMPARAIDDCDARVDANTAQIFRELSLL